MKSNQTKETKPPIDGHTTILNFMKIIHSRKTTSEHINAETVTPTQPTITTHPDTVRYSSAPTAIAHYGSIQTPPAQPTHTQSTPLPVRHIERDLKGRFVTESARQHHILLAEQSHTDQVRAEESIQKDTKKSFCPCM
jgi:hypothetical protein